MSSRHSSTSSSSARVHARRVGEAGREADRALGETLAHERAHRIELVRRGGAVVRAHGQQAQRGVGEQVADVDRGRAVEAREILGHAAPAVVELGLGAVPARQLRAQQRHRRVVGRRQRQPVLPEHLERHALVHLAGVVGMREQLDVGVRVHVDEAGREHQPVAVERPPRGLVDRPRRTRCGRRARRRPPGTTGCPRRRRRALRGSTGRAPSDLRVAALDEQLIRHEHLPGREPAVDREHRRRSRTTPRRMRGRARTRPPRPACRSARAGTSAARRVSRSGSRATRSSQAAVRIEPGATALARTP